MQAKTKQRVVMGLTIAAFAFLGWQVYGLVTGQSTAGNLAWQQPDNDVINTAASVPSAKTPDPNLIRASSIVQPKLVSDIPQQAVADKPQLLTNQHAYMHMLNQFELAKMQRRLLEEEVGIASARSRIATFNDKTLKIQGGGRLPTTDDFSPAKKENFSLAYVEKLHGQWTATININGDFKSVQPGTLLADGRQIIAINNNGLTFAKGNQTQDLTFDGLESWKAAPAEPVAEKVTKQLVVSAEPEQQNALTAEDKRDLTDAPKEHVVKSLRLQAHVVKQADAPEQAVPSAASDKVLAEAQHDILFHDNDAKATGLHVEVKTKPEQPLSSAESITKHVLKQQSQLQEQGEVQVLSADKKDLGVDTQSSKIQLAQNDSKLQAVSDDTVAAIEKKVAVPTASAAPDKPATLVDAAPSASAKKAAVDVQADLSAAVTDADKLKQEAIEPSKEVLNATKADVDQTALQTEPQAEAAAVDKTEDVDQASAKSAETESADTADKDTEDAGQATAKADETESANTADTNTEDAGQASTKAAEAESAYTVDKDTEDAGQATAKAVETESANTADKNTKDVALDAKQENKLEAVKAQMQTQPHAHQYTDIEHNLLAASPHAYTIQLIGARDPGQLAQYIAANNLDAQAKIFHTYYLGADWFVLTYGLYDSRQTAYDALAKMQQAVRDSHPWVRRLSGVQRAIQRRA